MIEQKNARTAPRRGKIRKVTAVRPDPDGAIPLDILTLECGHEVRTVHRSEGKHHNTARCRRPGEARREGRKDSVMPTEGEIQGAMARLNISRKEAETVDYAGDGVYVWSDSWQLWLGTLEGNRIALEARTFKNVVEIHNGNYIHDSRN